MSTTIKIAWALVVLTFVFAIVIYPSMPSVVPSHWNAAGQVNGTMGRFWGTFFFPLLTAGILALLQYIPRIDPLRRGAQGFRAQYDVFCFVMVVFFTYVYVLTIAASRGYEPRMIVELIPGMALLFAAAGWLLAHAKRNWFIGIRTPWTLSSDSVWDRTHRLGSRLFYVSAVLMLVGVVWPASAIWFLLVPILTTAFVSVVASYFYYRQER